MGYKIVVCWIFLLLVNWTWGQLKPLEKSSVGWEEASRQAAREGKMVFVAVDVDFQVPFSQGSSVQNEISRFLQRNTIGMEISLHTSIGKMFESKLLLYKGPLYAFFMPYGDLLEVVDARQMARQPEILIEKGKEALQKMKIRRSNSRSVRFEKVLDEHVWQRAQKEDKTVFIWGYRTDCQPCLLMEQDVFQLDSVADFYNRHFICVKVDVQQQHDWDFLRADTVFPFCLYMNADRKKIYEIAGAMEADQFLRNGVKALEKAEGVTWTVWDEEKVREKAKREQKFIFMDFYTSATGIRRDWMKKVYRDPEVAGFWNVHFVNVGLEGKGISCKALRQVYGIGKEEDVLLFTDAAGKVVHRLKGMPETGRLLEEAQRVVEGRGLNHMQVNYPLRKNDSLFVADYLNVLENAGMEEEAERVTEAYLINKGLPGLKEKHNWDLFIRYVNRVDSPLAEYFRQHRQEFVGSFGETAVKRKLKELWETGAYGFVTENGGELQFDEAGFKEYVKRLRKEKVEDWRLIARKARMEAAERMDDWRIFTELAEERWNEEEIQPDELFAWGEKINKGCSDKSIRFRAARWFALAALEIEKKERLTGKVKVNSYKGFFEKLVDELVE